MDAVTWAGTRKNTGLQNTQPHIVAARRSFVLIVAPNRSVDVIQSITARHAT